MVRGLRPDADRELIPRLVLRRLEWVAPRTTDRAAVCPTRLDAGDVTRIAKGLGRRAGAVRGTSPHGLRHRGITWAPDLSGGEVRMVQRFSRRARLETQSRYDDNRRRDESGAIAHLLGKDSA